MFPPQMILIKGSLGKNLGVGKNDGLLSEILNQNLLRKTAVGFFLSAPKKAKIGADRGF
jgi:hypothetical protein